MFALINSLFGIHKDSYGTDFSFSKKRNIEHVDPYIKKGVRVLFIADTHSMVNNEEIELMKRGKELYDAVIILGDCSSNLPIICESIPDIINIYGILGNHDSWKCYDGTRVVYIGNHMINLSIPDRNNQLIEIPFMAIDGSIKYKNSPDRCMYTQSDYNEILKEAPKAEICISHTLPSQDIDEPDEEYGDTHAGVNAIRDYIEKYKVPLHIYGHLHDPNEKILRNGTKSICVYKFQIIEL